MFLRLYLSYLHLFVSYCGNVKMAENNISAEYNPNENSDSEGYNNEGIRNNVSIMSDSDPDSLDIEVSLVGSRDISSNNTDFGDEWYDNGPKITNNASVTANIDIPNWTTNFTDINIKPFTQGSHPWQLY